jgi:hypothetical protein
LRHDPPITTVQNPPAIPATKEILPITDTEAIQIAKSISSIYRHHLANYSFDKYPAPDYLRYKSAYSALQIPNTEIKASLIWKWGHFGKNNFPAKQQLLIKRVEALWPKYITESSRGRVSPSSSADTFRWWRDKLPLTSYITAAFITHLVHHAERVPIIDQHNFRAMNFLICNIQQRPFNDRPPRTFIDIMSLKAFMTAILKHLSKTNFGELDRFLMMYGKSIKLLKPSSSHADDFVAHAEHHGKARNGVLSTNDPKFRERAIAHWKSGSTTQTAAMQKAAQEFGITLKKSYVAHAGSHFGRWRDQGYLK